MQQIARSAVGEQGRISNRRRLNSAPRRRWQQHLQLVRPLNIVNGAERGDECEEEEPLPHLTRSGAAA